MGLCRVMSWTVATWMSLPDSEKAQWIAYEEERDNEHNKLLKSLQDKNKLYLDQSIQLWIANRN